MLQQFDINCWEEPDVSVTLSFPPALINHLDVGDDIIRFEGDLVVSLCGAQKMERFDPEKHGGGVPENETAFHLPRSRKSPGRSGHGTGPRIQRHLGEKR